MKKRLIAILFICSLVVLSACGNKSDSTIDSSSQVGDGTAEDDMLVDSECFISIMDGEDAYDIGVAAYGDEVELPEPKGSLDDGKFVGWLNV